jgi:pimeloyl-ACP methyl ester carboxylesterase
MGGGAAINFALLRPELVRALVVVDSSLGGYELSAELAASYAAVRAEAQANGVASARLRWLSLPLFRSAMANPAAARQLRTMVDDYSGWHWLNPDRGRPLTPPAIERLHAITAPTLVAVGEQDTPDYLDIATRLAGGIAGAREVTLSGVGHVANLEDPENFNAAVLEFLDSLPPVSPRGIRLA